MGERAVRQELNRIITDDLQGSGGEQDPFAAYFPRPTVHSHQLQLIVPSLTRHGDLIDDQQRSSVLFKLHSRLCSWSGGFISRIGDGHWLDSGNVTVIERITTLEAYGSTSVPDGLIDEILSLILLQLDQDSVALIVDGTLQLYNRLELTERTDAPFMSETGEHGG